jgi:cytochrome c-type biogenesis protein CcmH
MTWFALVAAVLVAVALLWILPTLLRRTAVSGDVRTSTSNLAIIRDQLAELERDLSNGTLSQQQYQQAREDLERRALEEARDDGDQGLRPPSATRWTALALGIAIPLCAALLYWQLGNPDALSQQANAESGHDFKPGEVEAMVSRLAARLEKTPDDGNGWALLGRSYLVMQRYQDAADAYGRAVALIKNNADLLADYADALAMSQGRSMEGKPMQLILRALQIDPAHWKALAMAGSAAFDRKDYKKAIAYWETILQRAEPNSELARDVAANIEEARKIGGIKSGATAATSPLPAPAAAPASAPASDVGASVQGTVRLSAALAAKVDPSDTVFIFARAPQGSRMPLAIIRRQVKDLPFNFSLDDTQGMSPATKLSSVSEVVVDARVSKSANAMPQSGDMLGSSKKVNVGARNVAVVIDSVVP